MECTDTRGCYPETDYFPTLPVPDYYICLVSWLLANAYSMFLSFFVLKEEHIMFFVCLFVFAYSRI